MRYIIQDKYFYNIYQQIQMKQFRIHNRTRKYTHYYYVYSFNTVVEMFNTALVEAFQKSNADAGFSGVNLPTQNPPFFEWDSDNAKFILNGDVIGFDDKISNHISISCDTALYTLISGFQASYYISRTMFLS